MGATKTAMPSFPFVKSMEMDHDPEGIKLLEENSVVRVRLPDGNEAWVALSYETVRRVVTDDTFSRRAAVEPDAPAVAPGVAMPDAMNGVDGAEHAAVRKLFAKTFAPRTVDQMRPWIDDITVGLLDKLAETSPPVDLISSFIAPIPGMVFCQLFGIPYEDRERFRTATDRQLAVTGASTMEDIMAGIAELQDYLRHLAAVKRAQPADDLTTELVQATDEGVLTEDQLINNLFLVLTAGQEATVSQLSNSLAILLGDREQYERLARQPELIPNALEELMRYLILTQMGLFIRIATKDTELGGQLIRAGEGVVALHNVANRDPAVFDDPNRIDLERDEASKHLSFGAGAHYCIGAHLGRMQMQIALTRLTERFPGLRLAVPADELEWKPGRLIRCLTTLPVEW